MLAGWGRWRRWRDALGKLAEGPGAPIVNPLGDAVAIDDAFRASQLIIAVGAAPVAGVQTGLQLTEARVTVLRDARIRVGVRSESAVSILVENAERAAVIQSRVE